eukprot:SAG22_NODE_11323_length_490_cov_0.941176_1_plen_36_part_10
MHLTIAALQWCGRGHGLATNQLQRYMNPFLKRIHVA